jgi:hypothetical protein
MTGDRVAALRDAASYRRPNARSLKALHIARQPVPEAAEVTKAARDTDHPGPRPYLTACCSGELLSEAAMWRLDDAPFTRRCRRPACRGRWPATTPTPSPRARAEFGTGAVPRP